MPTPTKPFSVLKAEGKSHRTKKELKQRQQCEESLTTGVALKERISVKNNTIAHREFKRINSLLKNIEKNDAIYEPVINRYAIMQAECCELEERRELYYCLIQEIRSTFKGFADEIEIETKAALLIELSRELSKITNAINNIDKIIQTKRRMLLDIEKENIMTIAAALRSIPKKEEKESNPLLKALRDE